MEPPNPNTPLHDPIASRLGYLLRRASSAMMTDLGSRLADIGLRPVEATILILVGANPGCIQSDLGRVLGIKRANMAPLISALSAKGYLDKSPVDGRSLALTLTEPGEAIRSRADAIMDELEQRFGDMLDGWDQGPLRAMLSAIAAKGEEQGG
ncbi:MarR family winged helix-turn-helix transcriptional regulator [Sphingobium sp. CCH11-B1]|jgi:DNA-binding MarR family transcriptional regulator|uniref:MarR family winged helix-turn-helix transcriptional regulator n=1 Tax=Sphingobium sp. CCH11-B1 TaxID=1768781 RepID=UPI000830AB1B|nr:MarR family winged helix-turn-helix transcriptional regulator [Sphingobium sp. CCH11-B1]MEA3389043.1 MarR family winged helix-turn-helix transcriptional regulator [Pseudomonadota bacterium]